MADRGTSLFIENGNIISNDPLYPHAHNLLIEDGLVRALDLSEEEADSLSGVRRLDLAGATCVPGLHDTHLHLVSTGVSLYERIDVSAARSVEEVADILREEIENRQIPEGGWVVGYGWNQQKFSDRRMPRSEDLDRASTKHMVLAFRVCLHVACVNTPLLEACASDSAFRSDKGVVREEGKAVGILTENAIDYAERRIPVPSDKQVANLIARTCGLFASQGLTTVESDDLSVFPGVGYKKTVLETFSRMRDEGKLPVRVIEQAHVSSLGELRQLLSMLKSVQRDDFFSIAGIKLILDGSLGGRTAAVLEPYMGTDSRGTLLFADSELFAIARLCRENNLGVLCHAIGDRAIEQFIRVIPKVYGPNDSSMLPRIIHCQLPHERQLDALAAMRAAASIQPMFAVNDRNVVGERITVADDQPVYGWRTMLGKGLLVTGSSDSPVESSDPLTGIDAAVTRMDTAGDPPGGWMPQERLSPREALSLYTDAAARGVRRSGRFGLIRRDCAADLTVLSGNPLEDGIRIRTLKAVGTVVNGRIAGGLKG